MTTALICRGLLSWKVNVSQSDGTELLAEPYAGIPGFIPRALRDPRSACGCPPPAAACPSGSQDPPKTCWHPAAGSDIPFECCLAILELLQVLNRGSAFTPEAIAACVGGQA